MGTAVLDPLVDRRGAPGEPEAPSSPRRSSLRTQTLVPFGVGLVVDNNSSHRGFVWCGVNGDPSLASNPSNDFAKTDIGSQLRGATLATQVTEVFSSNTSVRLRCNHVTLTGTPKTVKAEETKIILVPIGGTTRTQVNG